jgi:hypothetical protein
MEVTLAERAKAKAKAKPKSKKKDVPAGATGSRGKVAKASNPRAVKGGNGGGPSAALIKTHHEKLDAIETRMKAAKAKYDQIRGEHRSAYAVVKQDGIVVDDFKLARELDKRDHGEVVVGYANVGTYLAAIKSELAIQLDLFQELSNAPPHNPSLAGAAAFANSEPRSNNPYQQGTEEYAGFDEAWMSAANAAELKDGEGQTIN